MANVQHSALTGAELHEPKGVATATSKQVYISDGLASGAWTDWPTGFGYYLDGGASQSISTTESLIAIDKAGTATNETALPRVIRGVGTLWATDKITPVAVGDAYEIRLDVPVTAKGGAPAEVTFTFDIGGSNFASAISIVKTYYPTGKAAPYTISLSTTLFTAATFVANGCQIWAATDTGTLTVLNPAILITRVHGGGI